MSPGQNSNVFLQDISDDASSLGDVSPALSASGFSTAPAISIANDVIAAMLLGGPDGQPFNWKWNRMNLGAFYTISYQQDYFVPGVVNLGWLESCWSVDINQTSQPKEKYAVEVHRDLMVTFNQTGGPGKICWMQNDTMQSGTWGQTALASPSGLNNPGPGVVITNPANSPNAAPVNPTTCISDAFGNLWTVTTYGTCGNSNPFATNTTGPNSGPPVYPTYQNQSIVATTVNDGTVVWTAINPKGQGFRLNPIPPLQGVVWLVQPTAQMRVPVFKSMMQTLEPVPDDFATYFKQGFFCECYRRNPDAKVRARYPSEKAIWLEALDKAVKQGQREMDDFGFYPGRSVMDNSWGWSQVNPAQPFGPGW